VEGKEGEAYKGIERPEEKVKASSENTIVQVVQLVLFKILHANNLNLLTIHCVLLLQTHPPLYVLTIGRRHIGIGRRHVGIPCRGF